MEALANDAAFLDRHGWFVDKGAVDIFDEVILRFDGDIEFAQACSVEGGEDIFKRGEPGEGEAESADIAGVAGAGGEAGEQPVQILDRAEDAA